MKIFFVVSQYKTGSKLLCSLLDSHPDIVCPHEIMTTGRGHSEQGITGEMSWHERAAVLAEANPDAKLIGLHGQVDMMPDDIYHMGFPIIGLRREDEVLGGVKQTLMDVDRLHGHFDLNVNIALDNTDMRRLRDIPIMLYSTFKTTFERLTRGGKEIKRMPWILAWRMLNHIGARKWWYFWRLKTTISKEPPMLPKNLQEIYKEDARSA